MSCKPYEGGNERRKDLRAVKGTMGLVDSERYNWTSAEQTLQEGVWVVNGVRVVIGAPENKEMHPGN